MAVPQSEEDRPPEAARAIEREPLIELAGVEKTYRMGKLDYRALRGVDLSIGAGEMVAVVGPSGSGKTTIMNLITGIDRPTALALVIMLLPIRRAVRFRPGEAIRYA